MRKAYINKKTNEIIFVLFDIYFIKDGICGKDKKCKAIKHYQTLNTQYMPCTTTMDNLLKNYTLIVEPDEKIAKQLDYILRSK